MDSTCKNDKRAHLPRLVFHKIIHQSQTADSLAFTLIELLVTVAIVGILAAFAMANFEEYRRKTNDLVAISQIKNLRTSLEAGSVNIPVNSPNEHTFEISTNGVVTFVSTINGVTFSQVAPGFKHQTGVAISGLWVADGYGLLELIAREAWEALELLAIPAILLRYMYLASSIDGRLRATPQELINSHLLICS